MHPVIAAIPAMHILQPGGMYIISPEKGNIWDRIPIDWLYVITRDEEILPALHMEMCVFVAELYELKGFVKWSEVLVDCYEFRFRCLDKAANREIGYSLFLHRLQTFKEISHQPEESIMNK